MSDNIRQVARGAATLRLVHGGTDAADRSLRVGLTLLTRNASVSKAVLRAHALKSCLERIGAVHRQLARGGSGDPGPRMQRAEAALERAQAIVLAELAGDGFAPASEHFYCSAEEVVALAIEHVRDRADAEQIELWVRTDRGGIHGDRDALVFASSPSSCA